MSLKLCSNEKLKPGLAKDEFLKKFLGGLNYDEIIVIGAGILRVTNTKFFIDEYNGGLLVKSFVMAEIDTDELETLLEREVKARLGER